MKLGYVILALLGLANIQLFNAYQDYAFLSVILSVVVFSGSVILFAIKRNKHSLYTGLIVIGSLFIAAVIMTVQSEKRFVDSEQILTAINQYKKENGKYPENLKQLEPDYFKRVPQNWFGLLPRQFDYQIDGQEFRLTAEDGHNIGRTWRSSMGAWDSYD